MSNEGTRCDDLAADADFAIQFRFERELASLTATQNGSLKQLIETALPADKRDVFDTGMASWADAIARCAREYHRKWTAISKGTAEECLAAAEAKISKAILQYLRIPNFQAEQWDGANRVRASIRDVCLCFGPCLPAWFHKRYLTSSKLQWPKPPTHLPEDLSRESLLEVEKQFAHHLFDGGLLDVFCDVLIDTAVQGAVAPPSTRQIAAGTEEQPGDKPTGEPQEDDVWNQINHELVNRKLVEFSRDFNKRIAEDAATIQFNDLRDRIDVLPNVELSIYPVFEQFLASRKPYFEELADRTYGIYCGVWGTQGKTKSAEFVRVVYEKDIAHRIDDEKSKVADCLKGVVENTRYLLLDAQLEAFEQSIAELKRHWQNKVEIKAGECEYSARASAKAATEKMPEPAVPIAESKESEAAGTANSAEPLSTADKQTTATSDLHDEVSRRAAVDDYIRKVREKTGKKISRADIWRAAGYTEATEFERWQGNKPKQSKGANERFIRVLFKERPHLK
jgi:hypothetical protein